MQGDYTYWKKPWHRNLVLIVFLLEVINLWSGIADYRDLVAAGVFTPEIMAEMSASKKAKFALDGSLAAAFLGVLIIGEAVRSASSAHLAEGILLAVWSVAWIISGNLLGFFDLNTGISIFGYFITLISFGGAVHSFWSWSKKRKESINE